MPRCRLSALANNTPLGGLPDVGIGEVPFFRRFDSIMKKVIFLRFILLVSVASICPSQDYVIPNADYNDRAPSPPSIDGKIRSVASNKLVVESKICKVSKHRIVTIRLSAKTRIFTVYGGYVDPKELVAGQRVRIWYTVKNPTTKSPTAAAIMLASTNPSEDWPK